MASRWPVVFCIRPTTYRVELQGLRCFGSGASADSARRRRGSRWQMIRPDQARTTSHYTVCPFAGLLSGRIVALLGAYAPRPLHSWRRTRRGARRLSRAASMRSIKKARRPCQVTWRSRWLARRQRRRVRRAFRGQLFSNASSRSTFFAVPRAGAAGGSWACTPEVRGSVRCSSGWGSAIAPRPGDPHDLHRGLCPARHKTSRLRARPLAPKLARSSAFHSRRRRPESLARARTLFSRRDRGSRRLRARPGTPEARRSRVHGSTCRSGRRGVGPPTLARRAGARR